MSGGRNITFDMMKGVGILLVIIGHVAHGYGLYPVIYVFHMPLFFIVSGYFYKPKHPSVLFKRDVKLLLLPYCLVAFLILMYGATMALVKHDISKFTYWLEAFLYAGVPEPTISSLWFLLAMFWCRMIYNLLNVYILEGLTRYKQVLLGVITLLIFVLAVKFIPIECNYYCWVIGLSSMFFYMIGHAAKLSDLHISQTNSVLFVILGFFCLYLSRGDVEMHMNRFDCLLLNIIAAVSVTYFIYWVCARCKEVKIGKWLAWFGRYSLATYCIHSFMFMIVPMHMAIMTIVPSCDELVVSGGVTLLHIVLSVLFCLLVERVRVLRVVFNIK